MSSWWYIESHSLRYSYEGVYALLKYIGPNFSHLPEKSNMFGQCIFVAHGGGGKESSCFEVIGYGKPQRGWMLYPPPTVGTF